MFTDTEKKEAMATARSTGAVGAKAIVPKTVRRWASEKSTILDYGCGVQQRHVIDLCAEGYRTFGYDFSIPGSEENLNGSYDFIMVSNVINVQTSLSMLTRTLRQIAEVARRQFNTVIFINYPSSPRKLGLTTKTMEAILTTFFHHVIRLDKCLVGNNIVWACQVPQKEDVDG